ncbi:MAG: cytochrome-c peroxidase [Saprospiraceae bacterium]
MKKINAYISFFILAVLITACEDKSVQRELDRYSPEEWAVLSEVLDLPEETYNYDVEFPSHFSSFGGTDMDINEDMATLGRVLFYDPVLSANNTTSCASCHIQESGFSDKVAKSDGFEGGKTKRNSFALGTVPNVQLYYGTGQSRFFWDHRAGTVAEQSAMTISDPVEMGMNLENLAATLEQKEYYRILFKKAFKQDEITNELAFTALTQFLNSFNNTNTKFDKELEAAVNPENDFSGFTAQENAGKALFNQNCASCHSKAHVFIGTSTANNGLQANYEDKGIGALSNNGSEDAIFKVPLLRNVTLTAPYMHDGRFATLEEVIDHYSTGIEFHQNLHFDLRQGNQAKRMNFTNDDKAALMAYLNTLVDEQFIAEVKYSDPFK